MNKTDKQRIQKNIDQLTKRIDSLNPQDFLSFSEAKRTTFQLKKRRDDLIKQLKEASQ